MARPFMFGVTASERPYTPSDGRMSCRHSGREQCASGERPQPEPGHGQPSEARPAPATAPAGDAHVCNQEEDILGPLWSRRGRGRGRRDPDVQHRSRPVHRRALGGRAVLEVARRVAGEDERNADLIGLAGCTARGEAGVWQVTVGNGFRTVGVLVDRPIAARQVGRGGGKLCQNCQHETAKHRVVEARRG